MFTTNPILVARQPVNHRNPVNRAHPLNVGRAGWYLGLPAWHGGNTLYDLMGLTPGVLTNMGNSTNGWRSATRPGGFSPLLFDGSAGFVVLGATGTVPFNYSRSFSCSAWINPSTISSAHAIMSSGSGGWYFLVSSGKLQLIKSQVAVLLTGNATLTANNWVHVAFTLDAAGNIVFYINGVQDASGSTGSTMVSFAPVRIGAEHGPSEFWTGQIESVSVWSRPLAAVEVKQDYDLSRVGYPGVLNRLPLWSYAAPVVGGAGRLLRPGNMDGLGSLFVNPLGA